MKAVACKKLADLGDIWEKYDVIGIDEGQFFEDLVYFCETAANKRQKIVILSALSGTFEKKGWPNI
jgi:thymidine kinase